MNYIEKCPVCMGTGQVYLGFYSGVNPIPTTAPLQEVCRSCGGKGVLSVFDFQKKQPCPTPARVTTRERKENEKAINPELEARMKHIIVEVPDEYNGDYENCPMTEHGCGEFGDCRTDCHLSKGKEAMEVAGDTLLDVDQKNYKARWIVDGKPVTLYAVKDGKEPR